MKYYKLNDEGKRVWEKWNALYKTALSEYRKEMNDKTAVPDEGMHLVADHIQTLDDEVEFYVFAWGEILIDELEQGNTFMFPNKQYERYIVEHAKKYYEPHGYESIELLRKERKQK